MPRKTTSDNKPFAPTMTREESAIRLAEAKVRLTEAKAESESVKARKEQLELDKACGELVYVSTAMEEFNKALVPVMGVLKTLPQSLVLEAHLTPDQHAACIRALNKALEELSKIEFHFETATEVEDRAREAHTKKAKGGKR